MERSAMTETEPQSLDCVSTNLTDNITYHNASRPKKKGKHNQAKNVFTAPMMQIVANHNTNK